MTSKYNNTVADKVLDTLKVEFSLFNKSVNGKKSLINFDSYNFFFLPENNLEEFYLSLPNKHKDIFYKDLDLNYFKSVNPSLLLSDKSNDFFDYNVNGSLIAIRKSSILSDLLKEFTGNDYNDCSFEQMHKEVTTNNKNQLFINPVLLKMFLFSIKDKNKELFHCNANNFDFAFNKFQNISTSLSFVLKKFNDLDFNLLEYSKSSFNCELKTFVNNSLANNKDILMSNGTKINIFNMFGVKEIDNDCLKSVLNNILSNGLLPNGEEIVHISDSGDLILKSWINGASEKKRNDILMKLFSKSLNDELNYTGNPENNRLMYYFRVKNVVLNFNSQKDYVSKEDISILSIDLVKSIGLENEVFVEKDVKNYKTYFTNMVKVLENLGNMVFTSKIDISNFDISKDFKEGALKISNLSLFVSKNEDLQTLESFKDMLPSICKMLWHSGKLNTENNVSNLTEMSFSMFRKKVLDNILASDNQLSNKPDVIEFKL